MRPLFLLSLSVAAVEPGVLLKTHCASCHQGAKAPAGLDFSAFDAPWSDQRWVRIHDAVRDGAMPPNGGLKAADRAGLLRAIVEPLTAFEKKRDRSVLRRLNRYEYESTVRDVLNAPWLQLKDSLPEDGLVARFNKSGHALDISHVQMARYMETAEQALRGVLKASKQPVASTRYYARDQRTFLTRMRYSSFNTHPERATIPVLGFDAQPEVLKEKAPLTNPADREHEAFVTTASTYTGNNYHFDKFIAPAGGRYKLRFNAYSIWVHTVFGPLNHKTRPAWWRPDREHTSKGRTVEPVSLYALARGGEKRYLGSFDVSPEPAVHELEVTLLEGESIQPDAARLFRSRPGFRGNPESTKEGTPGVAYRWMEAEGPAKQAVQFDMQGEAGQAIRSFMTRVYRRAPTEAEVARYSAIARKDRLAGFTAVLCSPGFLYLEEEPGRLQPKALAARLSYFLANTAPDPAGVSFDKLLEDPSRFVNPFLDYWLDLRKLGDTTPDVTLYPDYYLDDLLTESSLFETQLFVQEMIRRDLPIRNLIGSRFTFLNAHLARHYGIPGVEGVKMRRVELPEGSVRGGLLTQASILKLTANGTTTSPVLRGAWIMERIVGDPAPPPPAGVPAVEPDTRGATTIRQQLDKHRSIASCAACHRKIDPPGFALENFDVFGAWRDRYRSTDDGEPVKGIGKNGHDFSFKLGLPVDASGEGFRDITGFKKLLLQDERKLARNVVNQLVTYATGAPVRFSDRPAVEAILDRAKPGNYGFRTLMREVVEGPLFTHK
jgi:hypothetical protein